jgi:ATP-dependent protease ClpP protease subunit
MCWDCRFNGIFCLTGGTKGSRLASPHSRMIHQPRVEVRVKQPLFYQNLKVLRIRDEVAKFILIVQAKPFSRWRDMNRDQFLSARELKIMA